MKNPKSTLLLSLAAVQASLTLFAASASAQVAFPDASPRQTIQQRVGLTDIEISYSRPGIKDRDIFGGLVPYGEVWRTGANAATSITFSDTVTLNGHDVEAGTYGLFSIPGEERWTIILSESPDQWGAYTYDEDEDVLRFETEPVELAEPVETFTIRFDHLRDESAVLALEWDRISVPVELGVDNTEEVRAGIEDAMEGDFEPNPMFLFRAASYYLDHDLDLERAHGWISTAAERNDGAPFIWHTKARIEAELGRTDEAIASAERSLEIARESGESGGFVELNEQLLSELR